MTIVTPLTSTGVSPALISSEDVEVDLDLKRETQTSQTVKTIKKFSLK